LMISVTPDYMYLITKFQRNLTDHTGLTETAFYLLH